MGINYYVFRINYYEIYKTIREEIINNGHLRQGWSNENADVNNDNFDSIIDNEFGTKTKRFKNSLKLIRNFSVGDIVVVPKIDMNDINNRRSFIILKVVKGYQFDPIEVTWADGEKSKDFGSRVDVEVIISYNYTDNHNTEILAGSFKSYRSPISNIYSESVINAINDLIEKKDNKNIVECEIDKIRQETNRERKDYLNKIIEKINISGASNYFEDLIKELFEKQKLRFIGRNLHDNKGRDIDLLFSMIEEDSFISDLININDETYSEEPQIWIQAKKKIGNDENDIKGIEQLIEHDYNESTNSTNLRVLISLVDDFKDETKELADKNNVILINGLQFASLLVKYGIDVSI